jgi:hypothetical protein
MVAAMAMPALAKDKAQYFVVMDTVNNCSVIEAKPSAGMKVLAANLPSEKAAKKALGKNKKGCSGVVEQPALDFTRKLSALARAER